MKRRWFLLGAIVLILSMMTGCPTDGGSSTTSPTVTKITVSPDVADVQQGTDQTFHAAVSGKGSFPASVTWTVTGNTKAGTKIIANEDGDGVLSVASDEPADTVLTVKASSTLAGYTCVFGTATVTVTDNAVTPTVTLITISPDEADVQQGGSQTFQANVYGTGSFPTSVTWTVEGNTEDGTVIAANADGDGVLSVDPDEQVGTITVRASSTLTGYTGISGTAEVTVTESTTTPSIEKVWLVGNMTDWLDGPKEPIELTDEGDGIFTWSGELYEDQYLKFSGNSSMPDDYDSGIWLRPSTTVTVDCANLDDPDSSQFAIESKSGSPSWKISVSGVYTITVDVDASSVTFARTGDITVDTGKVWLVGDMTNWLNGGGKEPIELDDNGDGTFTWTGELFPGYLKFNGDDEMPTDYNSGTWFRPAANVNVDCAALNVSDSSGFGIYSSSGGTNWIIVNSGVYTITVDVDNSSAEFVRTEDITVDTSKVWLVGDITNWLDGPKEPIELDDNGDGTFTWSGELFPGYLKFNGDDEMPTDYNSGIWYRTASDAVVNCATLNVPESSDFTIFSTSGMASWQIKYGGVYTIIVDVDNLEVAFERTEGEEIIEIDDIWVAAGTNWSPDFGEADDWFKFDKKSNGTYVWEGNFWNPTTWFRFYIESGERQFYFLPAENDTPVTKGVATEIPSFTPDANRAWQVSIEGDVIITIDPTAMTFTITEPVNITIDIDTSNPTNDFKVWGTAVNGAWTAGEQMYNQGGGIYAWKGTLTSTGNTAVVIRNAASQSQGMGTYTYITETNGDPNFGPHTVTAGGSQSFAVRTTGAYVIWFDSNAMTVTFLPVPSVISVTVTPPTANVTKGETQLFEATVVTFGGAEDDVSWSIVESHHFGTTIVDGLLSIDEAEIATNLTVKATSDFDGTKSGTAAVTVLEPSSGPVVYSVTVSPSENVSVRKGETQLFQADVIVGGGAVDTVTWSIVETVTTTTNISSTGLLTVDEDETLTSITVCATPDEHGFAGLAETVTVTIKAAGIQIDTSNPSSTYGYVGTATSVGWGTAIQLYNQGSNVYARRDYLEGESGNNRQLQFRGGVGPASSTAVPADGGTFTLASTTSTVLYMRESGTYVIWLDVGNMELKMIREE